MHIINIAQRAGIPGVPADWGSREQGAGRGGCRECRNKPLKLIMKGKGVVLKSGLKMIDWGIGELVCTQGV